MADPKTDIGPFLDDAVTEAIKLRADAGLAGTLDPVELSATLRDVRGRQDRIEELLRNTMRLRARIQRAAQLKQHALDDATDTALHERRGAAVTPGGEFSSARERTAEANLVTIDLRFAARDAQQLAHRCDEAVEVLRLTHRGLDGVRQDVHALLRATAFESHLER